MKTHLTPLREGQQFRVCQPETGISPYGKPPYGFYYNFRSWQSSDDVVSERQEMVRPGEDLVVLEAEWRVSLLFSFRDIPGGWWVQALRPLDGRSFGFLQRIDDDMWKERHAGIQNPTEVVEVCSVMWPDPSPRSLRWAVDALLNVRRRGRMIDIWALEELPLKQGVEQAIEMLRRFGVSDPEMKLRERGFQV